VELGYKKFLDAHLSIANAGRNFAIYVISYIQTTAVEKYIIGELILKSKDNSKLSVFGRVQATKVVIINN
jgi:hypothetical protein